MDDLDPTFTIKCTAPLWNHILFLGNCQKKTREMKTPEYVQKLYSEYCLSEKWGFLIDDPVHKLPQERFVLGSKFYIQNVYKNHEKPLKSLNSSHGTPCAIKLSIC